MALYRKGAGEGLLFIGGSLAHDADCCCSVCSDAVTVLCCLRGQSYPMGECECIEAGGSVVAAGSNCDGTDDGSGGNGSCSSTIVNCCFNGEFLSLTACDCAIIGGVANPATCVPIVQENGCYTSRVIEIRTRTAPYRWGCLYNQAGTGCGGATPTCEKPVGYPGTMCFPGCGVIGDCYTCNGGTYCTRFGSESFYKLRWEEGGIEYGPPGVVSYEEPGNTCGNICCDGVPEPHPWKITHINQYFNVCPGAILRDTLTEIQLYSGAGCGSVDGATLYQYDNSHVTPCVTPC